MRSTFAGNPLFGKLGLIDHHLPDDATAHVAALRLLPDATTLAFVIKYCKNMDVYRFEGHVLLPKPQSRFCRRNVRYGQA